MKKRRLEIIDSGVHQEELWRRVALGVRRVLHPQHRDRQGAGWFQLPRSPRLAGSDPPSLVEVLNYKYVNPSVR